MWVSDFIIYYEFYLYAIVFQQKNGKHILWEHLSHLRERTQADSGLYIGRRLTHEHINSSNFYTVTSD